MACRACCGLICPPCMHYSRFFLGLSQSFTALLDLFIFFVEITKQNKTNKQKGKNKQTKKPCFVFVLVWFNLLENSESNSFIIFIIQQMYNQQRSHLRINILFICCSFLFFSSIFHSPTSHCCQACFPATSSNL